MQARKSFTFYVDVTWTRAVLVEERFGSALGEGKQKVYMVGKKHVLIDPAVCRVCLRYIKSAVSWEFQCPKSGHQSAFNYNSSLNIFYFYSLLFILNLLNMGKMEPMDVEVLQKVLYF